MIFTLATDAVHSLPTLRRRKPRMERYHYTSNELFEQSLDVYRPSPEAVAARKRALQPSDGPDNGAGSGEPPVVALVVGSAWLGHRLFVYGQTSWWNSSGPKAVADLGYVCVCIRHRGSFMKTFTLLTMLFIVVMAALLTALMHVLVGETLWYALGEMAGAYMTGENIYLGQLSAFAMLLATGMMLMELGGVGAASFQDMQADVMDALAWLQANETKLGLQQTTAAPKKRLFVFGGYSSGGHVAATVTQQPHLWKERDLPLPHEHCDSILYISPVLSTECHHEELARKLSSLSSSTSPSSSSSLPSLTPSEASGHPSEHSSTVDASSISTTTCNSPTWLTNQVVKSVFGPSAPTVPSPIHTCEDSPPVPHLFVGCRNEMFGLNWLDTFFSSPQYSEMLNGLGIQSRYTAVESDHWNILNSNALSEVLRRELGWIEKKCARVAK